MALTKRAVAVRHVAFEDLGLLDRVLKSERWTVSYLDASVDDLTDHSLQNVDLVIVLGGPVSVYELESYPFLAHEIAALERRLASGRPTLGICLGCQLMARALGARVFAGGHKEIGWASVALTPEGTRSPLAALALDKAPVLHWHGDTFDLPAKTTRLAYNDFYENQAFSCGTHALALQFHLEADPHRLEEWYVGHAVELNSAGISISALRAQTATVAPRVKDQAIEIFTTWLAQLDVGAG